jgi:hypothetical protein
MKRSTFFVLRAVIALAYALLALIVPDWLLSLYGIDVEPGALLMIRFVGVELLAVGLLLLFARNLEHQPTLRIIMGSFLAAELVGMGVAIVGTLAGPFNALGWTIVLIYGSMSLGYAYFLLAKGETVQMAATG